MLSKTKKYFILFIGFGVLFLTAFAFYSILEFTGKFLEMNSFVPYCFFLLILFFLAAFFFSFLKYVNSKTVMDNLKLQNEHSFGRSNVYFNRAVFEDVVNVLRNKPSLKKGLQTIVVFSAVPGEISIDSNRKKAFMEMNGKVIDFLAKYFEKKKNRHVYCFEDGLFYIYCFTDNRIEIISMVNDINDAVYRIMENNNIHLLVSPNFGIEEVKVSENLLESIEKAISAKKDSEKNFEMFNFHQESNNDDVINDVDLIIDGLKNKEFEVYYQPKYNPIRGKFVSSEALLRWNSPTLGLIMPGTFLPIANAAGLSHELDVYVFERVLQDIHESKKKGRRIIPVSINFSLYEFYSSHFLNFILEMLQKYEVDPRLIQIEILETTSQANPFLSVNIIKRLREMGIRVLMDDFGIGYSNFGNLSKIPFDAIKIDKSYIDHIEEDRKARQIVQCLVDLGKINNLEVIAEGVDNKKQADLLYQMGIDTIQGFYYSKPLAKQAYDKFLISNPFEIQEDNL